MDAPRQPILNLPQPVTWLLIFLFSFHGVRQLLPIRLDNYLFDYLAFVPARYRGLFDGPAVSVAGSAIEAPDSVFAVILPFVGHTFIHADWRHLGLNLLWLMPFGAAVSRRLGSGRSDIIRFFMFYFLCGMAGAITHMIFYSAEIRPLVGASGAISGLMGGAARFMFLSGGFYGNRYLRLSPLFDSRIMIFAIVFLLINIVFGTIGSSAVQGSGLIAWQAHIGGFLAGLLLFGFFDRVSNANT